MPTTEGLVVGVLANKILAAPKNSPHFEAVQAQCAVAVELYAGVQQLADAKNGLCAQTLVRSLFETVIGAVILANHKSKLSDFAKHGKMTLLRLALSVTHGAFVKKQATQALKSVGAAEYKALYNHFKPNKNWHMLKREDAFKEAFKGAPMSYDGFYGRSSAIAHGEPFNVFQHKDPEAKTWKIEPRYKEWRDKWPMLAEVMAMFLMLHLIERVSKTFSLGLESELANANNAVGALAASQMASAKKFPDAK